MLTALRSLGETATLNSLTRGEVYDLEASPTLREFFGNLGADEQNDHMGSEQGDYEEAAFAVTVESTNLVSENAFRE